MMIGTGNGRKAVTDRAETGIKTTIGVNVVDAPCATMTTITPDVVLASSSAAATRSFGSAVARRNPRKPASARPYECSTGFSRSLA